jgi:putative ABC transport system substrate-binding protein
MRQRTVWLLSLGLTLGVLGPFVPAQVVAQSIAVLKSRDLEPFNQALAGFVASCDGHIIEYDLQGTERRKRDILRRIAADKPRLVIAIGPLAAQVVKDEVGDVPVVFFMVPHPHKYSLKGENIVGISLDIPLETQFATYKLLVPGLKTIGVIYDPEKTGELITESKRVAEKLGLKLLASAVNSQKGVPAALRSMLGRIEALWMVPDETVVTPEAFEFLLLAAFENQLPFLAASDIFVEVGAFASLSPDYVDVGRQACQLVQDIESGRMKLTKVDVIPPAKVNLAINLKTASKIGLTLSSEIVQSASKVYR